VAARPTDIYEVTARIDHQLTDKQRIYGRYYINKFTNTEPQYRPDVTRDTDTKQQSVTLNYNYALTPTTLFTVGANYLRSLNQFGSPVVGIENLTEQAGIHGFPTPGRDAFVGLPSISFTGYTGFAPPWGVPGRLWFESHGGKASANLIRGQHSLNMGYEYLDLSTYGRHGSCCSRGVFDFNGQYSGDGFADYLLGYPDSGARNYPLQTFGMHDSPYSAFYVQDFWKVHPNLTINLGIRYDYWHKKSAVRGNVGTFDLKLGKIIAGEDVKKGGVDLTSQPIAQYLGPATQDMWIPASQAGLPGGLFVANGYVSPRVGLAWRPFGSNSLVVRGGYGIFTSSFRGNATASAIVAPPYWTYESTGWSPAQLQRWETAWPDDPSKFVTPSVGAAAADVKSNKVHEWNLSVQKELFGNSALTVSYVGNRGHDLITSNQHNVVPPGVYPDLQAAKPYPALGDVSLYENIGSSWYNGLLLKWEKRFGQGLSYMASYSFSKHIGEAADDLWTTPTPFAPEGYNRGRTTLDRTHILALNGIYELPFGKGRKHLNNMNPVGNAILGGWQLSGIYNFTSGRPLTFFAPGGTLGNGFGTRANIVGPIGVSNPSAEQWFNPNAFAAPPAIAFGSSGLGIFDGPATHILDTSLTKNFYFTESKFLQFRWEMFNMPNHVNLHNPETTIGLDSTGKIFEAGDARIMQFGLKFIF
jgi:TonB dependent receptor-like, beta-barrel